MAEGIKKQRYGFVEYELTARWTPAFLADLQHMVDCTYAQWSLKEDGDEWNGFAWLKLRKSLFNYDTQGGRAVGPLYPYLSRCLRNEAYRLYSKGRAMSGRDIDKVQNPNFVMSGQGKMSAEADLDLRGDILGFARRAYALGVHVNSKKLYLDYLGGADSLVAKAFTWFQVGVAV